MRERIRNFWYQPPVQDTDERHRLRLLQLILGMCLLAALAFIVISLLESDVGSAATSAVFFLVCLISFWLVQRGSFTVPSYLLPLIFLAILTYRLIRSNGIHDIAASMYPFVIVFAALILGRRAVTAFLILSIASMALVVYLEMHGAIALNWAGTTDFSDLAVLSIVFAATALLTMIVVSDVNYSINHLRGSEQALRESEARNRALLNAIPDMIFELDKNGIFMNFIQSQEADLIVPPEDFVGKSVSDLFPASISSSMLFGIERTLNTDQTHAFEYQLAGRSGLHDYEARLVASGPDRVLAILRDITLRKWMDTEREALIKELEIKNAELERFTYTVSHDLKAPLITIKGFVGFLNEDAQQGNIERLHKDIRRISDAAEKMQRLLNELLELSRIGRLMNPPEEVPFEALAREAADLVQGRLEASKVQVDIQGNLPGVYGDRQRLVEVLQNLLDNGAKFMGDQSNPRIEIGLHGYENNKPTFFVRDNGVGIGPEYHERIFGLFNKLDPKSEGTGVGLALVKRIIEVHGGRIWVESEAGKGSVFYFTLQTRPQI